MPVSRLECTDWTPSDGPCDPALDTGSADTAEASDTADNDPNPRPFVEDDSKLGTCGRGSTAVILFTVSIFGQRRRRRDPTLQTD
jgi:hypothetical protein